MVAHACCRSSGESLVDAITKSAGVMAASSKRPCGGRPRRSARPQGVWRRVARCSGSRAARPRCRGFLRCLRQCPSTGWHWTGVCDQDHGLGVGMPASPCGGEEHGAGGLDDPALGVRDGDDHDEIPSGDSAVQCFKCFDMSVCMLFGLSVFPFFGIPAHGPFSRPLIRWVQKRMPCTVSPVSIGAAWRNRGLMSGGGSVWRVYCVWYVASRRRARGPLGRGHAADRRQTGRVEFRRGSCHPQFVPVGGQLAERADTFGPLRARRGEADRSSQIGRRDGSPALTRRRSSSERLARSALPGPSMVSPVQLRVSARRPRNQQVECAGFDARWLGGDFPGLGASLRLKVVWSASSRDACPRTSRTWRGSSSTLRSHSVGRLCR